MGLRTEIQVRVSAAEAQLLSRRPGALGLPKSSPLWASESSTGTVSTFTFFFLTATDLCVPFSESPAGKTEVRLGQWPGMNESFRTVVLRVQEQRRQQNHYLEGFSEHRLSDPFSAFQILVFKEAEEPEIKLPTFTRSWRKQGISRKTSTSASLTT